MSSRKAVWAVALVCAVLALSLAEEQFSTDSPSARAVLGRLQILPVMLAGLLLGWRWGLSIGLLAGVGVIWAASEWKWAAPDLFRWADLATLAATGLVAGLVSQRHRKRVEEHQRMAEQLRQAHAEMHENFEGMKRAERLFAVGQLSAGLAHEIRNPLASISGAAGILRRNASTTPPHAELLEIIEKECQRLNGMLTSFLEFAKPKPPQPGNADIGAVLDRVISLATHAPARRNITILKRLEDDIPQVFVDAEQLQQVLLNMLMNAIQASADSDEVVLAVRLDSDRLWVDVRDQGSGVKPEHVDRLFDPFFTTKEQGTGLGLPVAHEIVRSIGGMLKVNHNEDRGMTFSVGLPLSQNRESDD
ncbi:MAG: hypothetical protein KIT83_14940 [Bryobacterales bacterium]|nr:hypothetical protein [Bryobacterales bacterium]